MRTCGAGSSSSLAASEDGGEYGRPEPAASVDCEAVLALSWGLAGWSVAGSTVLGLQYGAISALGQQSFSKVEAFVKLCHLR
jgi:hypothetical protein